MLNRLSELKLYSLGIVRTTKERNSDIVDIIPIEHLTLLDGDLQSEKQNIKHVNQLPDKNGVIDKIEVNSDNYLKATWLPFGHSNRITSPDVVQGETVVIFRYSDTDEYYWTTIFREPSIRRLEDVVYAFGDIKDGNDAYDLNSSYYLRINTFDKFIRLRTSKTNSERFIYDVTIDTDNSIVTLTDDVGNSFKLESDINKITVTTNEDIELNTTRVTINASEKVDINTPITNISGNVNISGSTHSDGDITSGGSIIDTAGNTNHHTH